MGSIMLKKWFNFTPLPRHCVDCNYHIEQEGLDICNRSIRVMDPKFARVKEYTMLNRKCVEERDDSGGCGPDGKFFNNFNPYE